MTKLVETVIIVSPRGGSPREFLGVGWLIRNWNRARVHNHGSKKQQTLNPDIKGF
jgi:hypothetical protein